MTAFMVEVPISLELGHMRRPMRERNLALLLLLLLSDMTIARDAWPTFLFFNPRKAVKAFENLEGKVYLTMLNGFTVNPPVVS